MRITYSNLLAQYLRNTGVKSTDPNYVNIVADFNQSLGNRYQTVLAKMKDYRTETYESTFSVGMQTTLLSSGVAQGIATITSSSTTATVTTSAAHGYSTNNVVAIKGASPSGYNGTYTITVLTSTTFTYTLAASLAGVAATTAQYYPFPAGLVNVEAVYITVGSVRYPLRIINDEGNWNRLNAIQFQATAFPQYFFPRRDDFGIWPTPQAVYSGALSYHYRDRNLSVADYNSGTVTVTNGSYTVTGTGTFTPAMVGRWFTVTDTTVSGQGYFYRIGGYVSSTVLTLQSPWSGTTSSGVAFNIGETPELPEEGHMVLVYGTTADFYSNLKNDDTTAAIWENRFWTGDPSNRNRKFGDNDVIGGVIGLVNNYTDRNESHLVNRKPHIDPLNNKIWATTLSGS